MASRTNYTEIMEGLGIITEREILTVKHAMNQGRLPMEPRFMAGRYFERTITLGQTMKGIAWLKKNQNRACCKELSEDEKAVIASPDYFTFAGFRQSFPMVGRCVVEPVYVLYGDNGRAFAYTYTQGMLKLIWRR